VIALDFLAPVGVACALIGWLVGRAMDRSDTPAGDDQSDAIDSALARNQDPETR
jgi:hypothetical protein